MTKLVEKSLGLLENMFDEKSKLFSYSTVLQEGAYVNDFGHEGKFRYTLNVIVGLEEAARSRNVPWDRAALMERYLQDHLSRDENIGNRGLLLHILSLLDQREAKEIFKWLRDRLVQPSDALALSIQDVAWASFGITTYAEKSGDGEAIDLAERVIRYLHEDFMNSVTMLPRHDAGLRGGFVAFGGVSYFLMALGHFARAFDDGHVKGLFTEAVGRALLLQGENGEWPWFIDSATGRVMDWYQIYSVHQDSMAMLFLLPALDSGVEGVETAITKSYQWLFGRNQLQRSMVSESPFFIFRSIRRDHSLERMRRLTRAFVNKGLGRNAVLGSPGARVINPECRSYHLGWIIYVWANRDEFSDFTELRLSEMQQ